MSGYIIDSASIAHNTTRTVDLRSIITPTEGLFIKTVLTDEYLRGDVFGLSGIFRVSPPNMDRPVNVGYSGLQIQVEPKAYVEMLLPEGYFQGTNHSTFQSTGTAKDYYLLARSQNAYVPAPLVRIGLLGSTVTNVTDRNIVAWNSGFIGKGRVSGYALGTGSPSLTLKIKHTTLAGVDVTNQIYTASASPFAFDVVFTMSGVVGLLITTVSLTSLVLVAEYQLDTSVI